MIELKNLGKSYDRQIFSNFNFQFQENELIVFLGPSGCGKSTLMKIMSGIEAPSQGTVTGLQSKQKSVVFQEPRLLPWLSCAENIQLFSQKSSSRKVKALMQQMDLLSAQDLFPQSLSGGMKMRTAIARALMQDPEVLFLDEPFSALDEPTRFYLQEEFRHLYEKNSWSVFFVTHSIEEACFLATKIVIFNNNGQPPQLFDVDLPKERNKQLRADLKYFDVVNQMRAMVEVAWQKEGRR